MRLIVFNRYKWNEFKEQRGELEETILKGGYELLTDAINYLDTLTTSEDYEEELTETSYETNNSLEYTRTYRDSKNLYLFEYKVYRSNCMNLVVYTKSEEK